MKQYKKAYGLAAACVLFALVGWFIPSAEIGLITSPFFLLLGLVAAGFGAAGQFGSAKRKQWVEDNF